MNAISQEDMAYLANQSQDKINMMLSGMTTLMRDTDNKVAQMESQGWFQRMVKSITGKNKATTEEIRQNHDKLNAYMAEAIGELFNRGLVDEKIIMGLGTQINMLYADHVQLKQQLGAFVDKLNKKIESVDNYNMLIQEIDLGDYSKGVSPIVAICEITSLYDDRMLKDERKLEILRKKLENQNIISDEQINIVDCLNEIVNLPIENVGQVAMTLGAMYDKNPFAALMLDMIESYHYLPELTRKMKKKSVLVENTITANDLDDSFSLSAKDIYENFLETKIELANNMVSQSETYMEEEDLNQALIDAVINNDTEAVRRLISAGADVSSVDENDNRRCSVLDLAVCTDNHNKVIIQLLLDAGANADGYYDYFNPDVNVTPLMVAVGRNDADLVKMLIDAGATLDLKDKYGDTALAGAKSLGYNDIADMLIEAGATEDLDTLCEEFQEDVKEICRNFYMEHQTDLGYTAYTVGEETEFVSKFQLPPEGVYLSFDTTLLGTGDIGFAVTKWGIYTKYEKGSGIWKNWTPYSVLMSYIDEIHWTFDGDVLVGDDCLLLHHPRKLQYALRAFVGLFKHIAERRTQLEEDSNGVTEREHNILKVNGTW